MHKYSREAVERAAYQFLLEMNLLGKMPLDILAAIDKGIAVRSSPIAGFKLVIVPDENLGSDALTDFREREILVKSSVWTGCSQGNPRHRMTLAHEVGHAVLHSDHATPKARMTGASRKREHYKLADQSEREADQFASALLMPRVVVQQSKDAVDLAQKCQVSREAAAIRCEWVEVTSARTIPPDILEGIEKLRQSDRRKTDPSSGKSVLEFDMNKRLLWSCLEQVPGLLAEEYRSVDGAYIIRWSRYEQPRAGGWFVEGDKIVAWESTVSR